MKFALHHLTMQQIKRPVLFQEKNSDQNVQFILTPLFRSTHILGWTSMLIYEISWNCRRNMYCTSSQWWPSYAIKMCKYEVRRYSPHLCHGSSIVLLNMSSDSRKYMKWRYVIYVQIILKSWKPYNILKAPILKNVHTKTKSHTLHRLTKSFHNQFPNGTPSLLLLQPWSYLEKTTRSQ